MKKDEKRGVREDKATLNLQAWVFQDQQNGQLTVDRNPEIHPKKNYYLRSFTKAFNKQTKMKVLSRNINTYSHRVASIKCIYSC